MRVGLPRPLTLRCTSCRLMVRHLCLYEGFVFACLFAGLVDVYQCFCSACLLHQEQQLRHPSHYWDKEDEESEKDLKSPRAGFIFILIPPPFIASTARWISVASSCVQHGSSKSNTHDPPALKGKPPLLLHLDDIPQASSSSDSHMWWW
jgi:hypothetical protein